MIFFKKGGRILNILEKLYMLGSDVYPNEELSRHTSLAIGGPAKALVIPNSMKSMIESVRILMNEGETFRFMGMGTNLLVSNEGVKDFVLKTVRVDGVHVLGDIVIAESGVSLKRLCEIAIENSLSGLEELYGIPGSVGGAVRMNAGAYGKEMKDVLEWVEIFDGEKLEKFSPEELGMGYRKSDVGNRLVTRVALALKRESSEKIEYRMREFLKKRIEKQPVFERSAGSLFKRPRMDFYVGSAIESLGLKGFRIGGVKISEKHAGFMVNEGNGSFQDAIRLIEEVKKRVKEKFGEDLEMEVILWK
jgi:UDP-N-acetylmuramate dehydrogenase